MAGRRRRRRFGRRPGSGTYIWFAAGVSLLIGFALGWFEVGPGLLRLERAAVAPAGEGAADRAGAPGGTGAAAGAGAPAAAGRVGAEPWRRGVWVVRHALRTPEAIDGVIAVAREVGADALFVQVNGRMEAYYRSSLLPAAPDVAPGFDPLEYVLRRARAEGLQVHAWINAFTAGMLTERPADPDHVLNRRPEWVTVDRTGRSLWDYGWQEAQALVPARMLDPGVPAVQQFVFDVVLEVVDAYDVDGVHLDYVRYPSRRFGYHPESIQRFQAEHGFDPMALERDAVAFVAAHGRDELLRRLSLWDQWRRDQVTGLVERIGAAVAQRGRHFSVAAAADADDAVGEKLQAWPAWVERGLVDAVLLMAYSPDTERVRAQVAYGVSLGRRAGTPVYAGIGAYLLNGDAALLQRQVQAALDAGAAGVSVFSYDTLLEQAPLRAALRGAWGGAGTAQ